MKIGYARVSTTDQNADGQIQALRQAGVDAAHTYVDTASGKLASRPALDRLLDPTGLRKGDKLVVTKLDRLGRSLKNLIEIVEQLRERGVDLVVIDQGIDTSTASGELLFNIIGAVAQFERTLIVERTQAGLAVARARGRTGGQKPKLRPKQAALAQEMYDALGPDGKRAHTVAEIAAEFGVSRGTIYRYVERRAASVLPGG